MREAYNSYLVEPARGEETMRRRTKEAKTEGAEAIPPCKTSSPEAISGRKARSMAFPG